jgi:hypothetical protein
MFKNKISILVAVGVLIAIVIGLQFIKDQESGAPEIIRVIPEDAAVVIETENFVSLLKSFNNKNQFKFEFADVKEWNALFASAELIDSIIRVNKGLDNLLEGKKMVISGHISANSQLEFLYTFQLDNEKHLELIKQAINKLGDSTVSVRKRLYENQNLFDVTYSQSDQEKTFTYTLAEDIFIFSESKILAEEAVRRLKTGFSLMTNKGFRKIAETAGKNANLNIYINYRNFPYTFKNILSDRRESFYDFFRGFASWTELDMIYKNDAFLMSGYTFVDDSLNQYLNSFKGQDALNNDFLAALPGNTASFIAFNFSDPKKWKSAYIEYLQRKGDFAKRNQKLQQISSKYKKDVQDLFFNNIEGAVCIAWMNKNLEAGEQNLVGIVELSDAEQMEAELLEMRKADSATFILPDQQVGDYKAIPLTEPGLLSALFGEVFSDLKSNYYLFANGKLIFAENVSTLDLYLRKVQSGSRLLDGKHFIEFSKSMSSKSNIYAYLDFTASKPIFDENFNRKYQKIYEQNIEKFNKIQALAVQYGVSGDMLFTNFYTNFNPKFKKRNANIWEVQLDTTFSMKPTIVRNHNTENNEVIIQDDAKNLVLVGASGKVLWKKKIEGKIISEIHQIDKYKNNKLQYLFNTHTHLHLVDRNGNDVEGFPIKFKSPATNGIAVFDYDHDKDYRVLVACVNKSVYLLTADGGKVNGWNFGQTKGTVTLPAQHFVDEGKDYIVFADETQTYIVNRRGETRVTPKSPFEKCETTPYFFEKGQESKDSRFVTTGKNGDVYFIFLDGVVKKMSLGTFSGSHRFEYQDIDGDGKKYFVYTDDNQLFVFNRDKSTRFELKFENKLKNSLNLYTFNEGVKYIGVSPEGLNKVYLIAPNGKVAAGFPMHGNGPFSISKLIQSEKGDDLNLITGNTDYYLFNYRLAIK